MGAPVTRDRNYDIALDRYSFLSRGWTDVELGRYNGGAAAEKQGVFLSMFYALQNGHPDDAGHPWNLDTDVQYKGLSFHVQYWVHTVNGPGLPYHIHVWDQLGAPIQRGVVEGRRRGEAPFVGAAQDAAGLFQGASLFLNMDAGLAFGLPLSAGLYLPFGNGSWVIAHEMGHWLGFSHVDDDRCAMYANGGVHWDEPDEMDQQFATLARWV